MFNDISQKAELRLRLAKIRENIADKHIADERIQSVAARLVFGNVMVYVAFGTEVQTSRLISQLMENSRVTVFVPHTTNGIITPKRLLRSGVADRYGNLPEDCYDNASDYTTNIDCCITPLLGFNDCGYRIGYGKGCYDRYFATCGANSIKIGLAYSKQAVNFTDEAFDVPLDCCVTEKDVIYF